MSQYPNPNFPAGDFQPIQPPRTSGAAIASLILGILGCIPLVTGILAVILGAVGLSATKKPNVGGRGLAIAGLVLGLVSIIGWTGFGGVMGWVYVETGPSRIAGKAFVTDLSNGDITSAAALCVPGTSKDSLQATSDQMKDWGALIKVRFFSFYANNSQGNSTRMATGAAQFANAVKTVQITFVNQPDGSEKIKSWEIH
jgi:hypothetical protein